MATSAAPATAPTLEDRLAPSRRPPGASIMRQNWRQLLFLHWEAPVESLRPLIPPRLSVDTYEGRAYVGVIPFDVRGARARLLPPLPGVAGWHELNVRTYVHLDGHEPGVWFFSLDASNLLAALAARAAYRLPYCHAEMALAILPAETRYFSVRRRLGRVPAVFEASARAGEPLGSAMPGTLEHFLVERYLLYADWGGGRLRVAQVHHRPYPLQRAEVDHVAYETLLRADGLPVPATAPPGTPHVLFSSGVDVEVFAPRRPRTG